MPPFKGALLLTLITAGHTGFALDIVSPSPDGACAAVRSATDIELAISQADEEYTPLCAAPDADRCVADVWTVAPADCVAGTGRLEPRDACWQRHKHSVAGSCDGACSCMLISTVSTLSLDRAHDDSCRSQLFSPRGKTEAYANILLPHDDLSGFCSARAGLCLSRQRCVIM